MENEKQLSTKRIYWIDVARTIAIVSITLNHAVGRTFNISNNTMEEFISIPVGLTAFKTICYVFSRLGVPLFLMISGALLLGRDYSDKKRTERFIRHNWFNLFITTEIWLAIMYWFLQIAQSSILRTQGFAPALIGFLKNQLFIDWTTFGSMWYMPMILCVYFMIPIFSFAISAIDKKYFIIPLIIGVISGMLIPTINEILSAAGFNLEIDFVPNIADLFSIYMIFMLAGYYISKGIIKDLPDYLIIIGAILPFVLVCVLQFWLYSTPSDFSVRYQSFGLLISAAFLFELLRRKNSNPRKPIKWISEISKMSFGIYFLHIVIMTVLVEFAEYFNLGYIFRLIFLEVLSFILSIVIIKIFSKIPFCKKYLFAIKE